MNEQENNGQVSRVVKDIMVVFAFLGFASWAAALILGYKTTILPGVPIIAFVYMLTTCLTDNEWYNILSSHIHNKKINSFFGSIFLIYVTTSFKTLFIYGIGRLARWAVHIFFHA